MNAKIPVFCALVFSSLPLHAARAQSGAAPVAESLPAGGVSPAWAMTGESGDDKSDPGYALYKQGYALILDEKYDEARQKFSELLSKYPKSAYAADALYWTAYSLRGADERKAISTYKKFIYEYPKSAYYDDAVADLETLQAQVASPAPDPVIAPFPPRARQPAVPLMEPNMRNVRRQLQLEMRHMGRMHFAVQPVMPFRASSGEENLDEPTRLKMDALYALGDAKQDDKSFATLRDVAEDKQQPRPLRVAAMDALTNFSKFDVLQVFVDIAKKDTSEEIQGYAIDFIGESGSDKNQRVGVLEELYRSLPQSRTDQRQTIVYTIADVGNDRAVDFLKHVALSDPSYDVRRDAVYYLGSIGGEKARAALYEILKEK